MTLQKCLVSQSIFWAAKINLPITDGVGTTSIMRCSPHTFTNISYENKYTVVTKTTLDILGNNTRSDW